MRSGLIETFLRLWERDMPTYVFLNTETNEIEEHFMSYTKLDEFKESNPHLKSQVSAPSIVSGVSVRDKRDGGFKEVMSKIGDAHPGSNVHKEYGTKDIKREKTVGIIKKHRDIQSKKK